MASSTFAPSLQAVIALKARVERWTRGKAIGLRKQNAAETAQQRIDE
jgi:hypothetical protein